MRLGALAFLAVSSLVACGGDDESASTCTPGSSLSVSAASTSPACLAVAPGATVSVTNSTQAPITIRSASHPNHGSCPEIDALPPLAASASTSLTMGSSAKACGFHVEETGVIGEIRVGSPPGGGAREY